MKRSLNDWVEAAHDNARNKGWWDNYGGTLTPDEILSKLMLVVTEIAEAAEEVRVGSDLNETDFNPGVKPVGFAIELADAAIRIFDLCGALGLDLEAAVTTKHEYNRTRPFRHGGKAA